MTMNDGYLEPTMESATALVTSGHEGPFLMLNLLKFREVADYSAAPALRPDAQISGSDAFDLYVAATLPHLENSGGALLLNAPAAKWFIGPAGDQWDRVMLVRQTSVNGFLGWAEHEAYLDGIGHRMAALLDSRLLPIFDGGADLLGQV